MINKKIKIKIFSDSSPLRLEKECNKWLIDNQDIEIIKIDISSNNYFIINSKKIIISHIDIENLFKVENFNYWFNNPNNGAVYAHTGIFLRLDKLSDSQFFDYFESYGSIKDGEFFAYNEDYTRFIKFKDDVRKDWMKKIEERND